MRILVQLPYPGYLRMYGSTVVELARRGHEVLLSYDLEKHRVDEVDEIESCDGVAVIESVPWSASGRRRHVEWLRPTADYLRFLDKRFVNAPYLRARMAKFVPARTLRLATQPGARMVAPAAIRVVLAAERLIPPEDSTLQFLRRLAPDAIVVSPAVARGPSSVRQTDTIKAAQSLGVPVAAAIGSWDHLTTKGLIKVVPDRVLVWNEIQRREAVELHHVPADRVVLTGAQLFDQWFDREPSAGREAFVSELGLDPARPYVLYVGSSPNIAEAAAEIDFVRRWIAELRRSPEPVGSVGVLVRPHPGNAELWADVDLSDVGGAVAPRRRPAIPMSPADENLYFDSIHHSAAVVGINTSAIIECLIQRRPVLTVRDPAFAQTQEGTLHFQYLLPAAGGALQAADSLAEHTGQLADALDNPERRRREIDSFLATFVRPHGLARPGAAILADAIEELGGLRQPRAAAATAAATGS
jgi:hypothetical protein